VADGVDRHAFMECRVTDLELRGAAGPERRLGTVPICAGLARHAEVGNAPVFSENLDYRAPNPHPRCGGSRINGVGSDPLPEIKV